MSRLPKPGSDSGTWGDILNDYLSQEHNVDGTQKTLAITKGGTGATDTTTARTNLGAASATDLTSKADDSTVVHKTGTETITGNKDFTGGATINSTNIVVTNDTRLTDARTPTDGSVTDAKITSGGLSPSSINGGIISLGETSTTAYRGDRGKTAYDFAQNSNVFNVKSYGAVGNGTTDDTAAVQAALTAATSGGVVFFPKGTYKITSALTWPRGARLEGGMGNYTTPAFYPTILWGGAASGTMFEIATNGGVVGPTPDAVCLKFDAGTTNPAAHLIHSTDRLDWDFSFVKCAFVRCNGDAIVLDTGATNFHMYDFRADSIAGYLVSSSGAGGMYSFDKFTLDIGALGTAKGLIDWIPSGSSQQIHIDASNGRIELNGALAGNKVIVQLNLNSVSDPICQAFVSFNNIDIPIAAGGTNSILVSNVVSTQFDQWSAVGTNVSAFGLGAPTFQLAVGAHSTGPPAGSTYPFWVYAPFTTGGLVNSPQYLQKTWINGDIELPDLVPEDIGVAPFSSIGKSLELIGSNPADTTDAFTRADSTTTLGNADTGETWTANKGTWGISSNAGYLASATSSNIATVPVAADGTLTCDVTLSSTTNRAAAGLAFRAIDLNNHLQLRLNNRSSTHALDLNKFDGGALTQLATTSYSHIAGQTYAVKVVLSGTIIRCYLDTVLVIQYDLAAVPADAAKFTTPIGVGLSCEASGATSDDGGSRWDNLVFDYPFVPSATRYVGSTVGAPAGGPYFVGDFAIDQTSGGVWTCIAAGSPGTWVDEAATKAPASGIAESAVTNLTNDLAAKALVADPLGLGNPYFGNPWAPGQFRTVGGANRCHVYRNMGAGTIDTLAYRVTVASGNMRIAIYENTGIGRNACPSGAPIYDSGAYVVPAAGQKTLALGMSITMTQGSHWVFFGVDNNTASFVASNMLNSVADVMMGYVMFKDIANLTPPNPWDITGFTWGAAGGCLFSGYTV